MNEDRKEIDRMRKRMERDSFTLSPEYIKMLRASLDEWERQLDAGDSGE